MHRLKFLICALAFGTAACGSSDSGITSPTPSNQTTQEFTGTLTLNGARSYPFASLAAGSISATLVSLSPDVAAIVQIAVGVWDGTACQIVVTNDAASTSSVVIANVTTAGSLCARIADSQGTLPNPETFDIVVSHP